MTASQEGETEPAEQAARTRSPGVIRSGSVFVDDGGRIAQLHGIGVLQLGDTFWAWGEDKRNGPTFGGVACYTSRDLATWTFQGHALAVDEQRQDLGPARVVERPKVLQHPASGRFVMFLHIDSAEYSDARVGYAVSNTPQGPYTYLRSERPMGNESRDIGVFQDDDGTGYLLSEDRRNGLHIYRLAEDYLSVVETVSTTKSITGPHGYESPALVKLAGAYFLFGSDLTGWACNDNKVARSSSVRGPWSPWQDFAPTGSATFQSQVSTVIPVHGSSGTGLVYIGDRWLPDDLANSPAVLLPFQIDASGTPHLLWRATWSLDEVPALATQLMRHTNQRTVGPNDGTSPYRAAT